MTTTAPPIPTADFEVAWEEFFAAHRRARARAARDQPGGLSLSHVHLLTPLLGREAQTVGTLAASAAVAGPTATRMLDALERDGVVTRNRSREDRRVVTVALTEHGAALLTAKRRSISAKRRRAFRSLTPEEQTGAANLLRRLAGALEEL
jgi:MarR family transcriptional regulator, organic hydroperoxide resistance regulator